MTKKEKGDSMNYDVLTLSQKKKLLFTDAVYVQRGEAPFNINADYLKFNSWNSAECERELFVSLYPMLPLLEKTVPIEEADYILYSHPYARVEDMSPHVLAQLRYIDEIRRPGAEIIVVGKASNAEALLAGSIQDITFWPNHYAELVAQKFGMDFKDEYFVYESEDEALNIWPVNGCLRKCKFCRRTYMDIPFESLSLAYIKERLNWYQRNDPKKLWHVRLRAENLTEYGLDLPDKPTLADLFDLVSSYNEVKYISVIIGIAICEFTDEMLEAVCRSKKFWFMALNLEAGSSTLLKTIGKDHTPERALYIARRLREAIPKIFLSTTVMVGLPTETLSDINDLANLCINTTMNHLHIVQYGNAPKQPLSRLPQLSPQLREYHMQLLVRLIKQKKRISNNKDVLTMTYDIKLKHGSRTEYRAKKHAQERMDKYHLLTWYRKYDAFIPQLDRFVKHTDSVQRNMTYFRQRYFNSLKQKTD